MRALPPILALAVVSSLGAQPRDADELYQSNQWFAFRDALAQGTASAFHRGELALAFHDWPLAEKELSAAMKSASDPAQAFEAAMGLEEIYSASGRRKEGRALLARVEQIVRGHGVDAEARQAFERLRAQLDALASYPDQTVVARGASRLQYAEVENHLFLPLTVNGTPANYILDTGAQTSTISAGEAQRLGLAVHPAAIGVDEISAEPRQPAGVTVANDVIIGNFHFRNVMFLVTPGEEPGGIIGLPLMLAFETLRWSSDGTVEFGFPPAPRHLAQANLCLANGALLTETALGDGKLTFILDTGSYDTDLFPRFGRDFPALLEHPASAGARDIGNDVSDPHVTTLAEVMLRVGGLRTRLAPAPVLSRELLGDSMDTYGLLGMDLLGEARSAAFDFTAMTLTLDGVELPPASCALPPDFLCAPGWTCRVKRDEDGPCFVDRVPVEAWPGNPVTSQAGDGDHCVLSAASACAAGKLCRVVFDSNQSCHIASEDPRPVAPETAAAAPTLTKPASGSARDIVERWLKFDCFDLSPARDYVYLEDRETKILNKDGSVASTHTQTREVMNLYDATYARLIRQDGSELPPDKARAEQARFDKAVDARAHETPAAKAKRQESERKQEAESLVCQREFFDVFETRLAGTEAIHGRPAWVVELDPKPNVKPRCEAYKIFSRFQLKVWIDQQEYRGARGEGENIAPVTFGAILVRLPTGGLHIAWEQARHEDGTWLNSWEDARVTVKALLLMTGREEVRTTYSGYRKFQADSRIVPVGGNQ